AAIPMHPQANHAPSAPAATHAYVPPSSLELSPALQTNANVAVAPVQPIASAPSMQMMRVEPTGMPASSAPAARRATLPSARPQAAAGAARPAARHAPLPTPVRGSKNKAMIYTTVFVVAALGIGAVVA